MQVHVLRRTAFLAMVGVKSPSRMYFLHAAEQRLQGAGTRLCRLEANCVVMTRPFPSWPSTRVTRASRTVVSLSVRPGDRTLVESLMNSATPSLPAAVLLNVTLYI